MNKLIIDNRTDITDLEAVELVTNVIRLGRISKDKKQYCYLSIQGGYAVSTDLNKKSDRFIITKARA